MGAAGIVLGERTCLTYPFRQRQSFVGLHGHLGRHVEVGISIVSLLIGLF